MRRYLLSLGLLMLAAPCFAFDTQMPPLAEEAGCTRCHAIDHQVVGPAWLTVSLHYRDKRNDPATIDALVQKVSKGGGGNWGDVVMVPNDPLGKRQDKIQALVKYVLSLSEQAPALVQDMNAKTASAKK